MASFKEAAEQVKKLKKTPTNEELLELYAFFKQASVGDNDTDKPGIFDVKGRLSGMRGVAKKVLLKMLLRTVTLLSLGKWLKKYELQ
uniref:ACB domain-containing protein n=1 Tax=Ditylenchus dipsaci TaxID=166011 RepID=A0A915CY40_9BILA